MNDNCLYHWVVNVIFGYMGLAVEVCFLKGLLHVLLQFIHIGVRLGYCGLCSMETGILVPFDELFGRYRLTSGQANLDRFLNAGR